MYYPFIPKKIYMKPKFILLFCLLFLSIISQAQLRYLQATLQGSQQVPANASTGSGIVIVKYDMPTHSLLLYGDYQDLAATVTASHIHGIAAAGANAGVLFTLTHTGGTTGTISGSAILTAPQETALFAGNMYVNVHNATYPGGEIRGQLTPTTEGQTEFYNSRLQGSQQVPPNASTATGSATLLLDKTTSMVYLTGSFSGLAAPATASHIHVAAPHTNGPVKITLVKSSATSGTLHAASAITDPDKTEMMDGHSYVNVHNATYPGGEIRGQLNKFSQTMFFQARLNGSQEVPPNASGGGGTSIVKYNTETRLLELTGDYQNLAAAVTASHIHSPALPGSNASVLITLTNTGGTSGTLTGSSNLTLAQESDLFDGKMYVNVHNATYPGGEIRGQLTASTPGETQFLSGLLQGSQQNPVNGSAATGNVSVLLDRTTNQVYLTGNFGVLSTNATAAHIHRGPVGVNGPVIVPLNVTASTTGTITGSATVSQSFADSMVLGNTYVNIHNAEFPGGEIRAQLGNQVLPVRLTYFNAFKDRTNIALIWESAQEIDLKQYVVEQQDPLTRQWISKGVTQATGGSTVTKYRLNDAPIVSSNQYVIYRLKMVDKNGNVSYSQAVRINYMKPTAELNILTNPVVKGVVRYNITGLSSDKKAEVSIVDFGGRVMFKTVESGLSTNTIEVGKLSPGIYKLIVRVEGLLLQQSFIK